MTVLEIYLHDLKKEMRKKVLEVMGEDGNFDICPIAIIEVEVVEDADI